MFWDICTSIARLTKQPKLVPDISSKSAPFVPSRGDASKRRKIFSIWPFNSKGIFAAFACVPTALYKRDGFTGNVWYKLRLLSQPSNYRTNIPKNASGSISWLIPKCKEFKLRPPQILLIPRSRLYHIGAFIFAIRSYASHETWSSQYHQRTISSKFWIISRSRNLTKSSKYHELCIRCYVVCARVDLQYDPLHSTNLIIQILH